MSIDEIKSRLTDVPGIEALTMQTLGGRDVYSIAGKVIGVPVGSDISSVETAIRTALGSTEIVTAIPMPLQAPEKPGVQALTVQPASGGFAASLKAILNGARADLEQARTDGLSKVQEAVTKLGAAKDAVVHVTSSMAKTIHDEADSVLAELGQISNSFGGENN